ncbi:hypothetical protein H6F43_13910 [Leptolyngbya sp. FACHB-36]|uniref:hypothetical protein n=1 Tax=Leptolyngbya sp. FACHB-36 TaxID=2692808 RepID=UPI001680AF0B|nr:hypothetical protein [Leptolyngbya sp. FACHB-36]MBD2021271.1 hypothetical protein [Leptolyngbya sp. FACHB-36]
MKTLRMRVKPIAITAGIGLLTVGGAIAYWQISQPQGCVHLTSSGGQEVTFSRGCIYPQRYKKWAITALAEPSSVVSYQQLATD